MSMRRHALLLAATLPAAACSGPPPAATDGNQVGSVGAPAAEVVNRTLPEPDPAETARVEADYLGKWIGPEGLVLEVTPKAGGGVTIVNQWTLDDRGTFDGSVTAEGLRFVRSGEAVTARPGDGDATGMKWLPGKKDCLTVKPGWEGYCRA